MTSGERMVWDAIQKTTCRRTIAVAHPPRVTPVKALLDRWLSRRRFHHPVSPFGLLPVVHRHLIVFADGAEGNHLVFRGLGHPQQTSASFSSWAFAALKQRFPHLSVCERATVFDDLGDAERFR